MMQKNLRFIPLIVLLTASTGVHADGVIKHLYKVDKQLSHIENTINGTHSAIKKTQNKYNNTTRTMKELKDGTYAEKSVGRAVKKNKEKAVNNLIDNSNNVIRKATNSD